MLSWKHHQFDADLIGGQIARVSGLPRLPAGFQRKDLRSQAV